MKMELMSPAGSLESIYAAARAGADAVYFGGGRFNARRNAKNLSDLELETAIKYLNMRGVKSYITVNTLLTDRELRELMPFLQHLNNIGASAVIVQDVGVAKIIRTAFPDLPIHASTQLSVHNLAGAMAMKRIGFSRVVLSRELPLSEIAFITQNCNIETEIFCHGALCMCYSGQCYMSSAIGGRSGNRGLCAQPCRMQYSFFGEAEEPLLSLKDLCLAPHIRQIEKAGVACIKIEGRMKRPEYTAYVTQVYRRAIDSGQPPSGQEMRNLELMFSRDGFTDGYFADKKGISMFGSRDEGGDPRLLRTLHKEMQSMYLSGDKPTVLVDMDFSAETGKPMELVCREENGRTYSCTGPVAEVANFKPTMSDEVTRSLAKTGGTLFIPRNISANIERGLKIPASSVNAMRRQALDALTAQRRQLAPRRELEWNWGYSRTNSREDGQFIFSFLNVEQITPEILAFQPKYIYLPMGELYKKLDTCKKLMEAGHQLCAVVDRVTFDREWSDGLARLTQLKQAGVVAAVCTNAGHPILLEGSGFELRGDFGLNVFNSQAMKEYRALGLTCQTLSFELNFSQIRDISKCTDTELIVYGRLPLMITENCIIKNRRGNQCSCHNQNTAISDKTGRSFPLLAESGHRNTLYNSDKLFLADKGESMKGLGITYFRLNFTTENPRECVDVVEAYINGGKYMPERMTRGLYARGVE